MPRKRDTPANDYGVVVCIAWLALFVVTGVALLALQGAVTPAHAASSPPPRTAFALEEEVEFAAEEEGESEVEEEGEEEAEESECEETGEELEEEEITPVEAEEICKSEEEQRSKVGPGGILPEECVVRTFDSNAIASPSRNRVELTTHYTTFEPTAVTIEYGLGSSRLGTAKRHLGASGVIHLDKHLSDSQTTKLEGAHKLAVQIDVRATPGSCRRYYEDSAKVHHS